MVKKLFCLHQLQKKKKGEFQTEFQKIRKDGFQRVKVDGAFYTVDKVPKLEKNFKHDIDIVIDRLISGSIDPVRLGRLNRNSTAVFGVTFDCGVC